VLGFFVAGAGAGFGKSAYIRRYIVQTKKKARYRLNSWLSIFYEA
jgi:hypothetical protein